MRRFLMGVVLIGVAFLATSCLLDQGTPSGQQQSDHTTVITTGGGDTAVFWVLLVLLIVAGGWLLWHAAMQKARADFAERMLLSGDRPELPRVNGREYRYREPLGSVDYRRELGR